MSTLSERLAYLRENNKKNSGVKTPETEKGKSLQFPGSSALRTAPAIKGAGDIRGAVGAGSAWDTGGSKGAKEAGSSGDIRGTVGAEKETLLDKISDPLKEWTEVSPFVFERVVNFSFSSGGENAEIKHKNSSFIIPGGRVPEELIFYDLETTGLSGGAGNTAFLIGTGKLSNSDTFSVTQLFLADYPGEPFMLERSVELFGNAEYFVSYNGRSFDSQVLKTRFMLNRMRPPEGVQADLLYPARRLWGKVIPDAKLGSIEKYVLGFSRNNDLPGSLAPKAWFDWLENGSFLVKKVFDHNAEDIFSLAKLLFKMEEWGEYYVSEPSAGTLSGRSRASGYKFSMEQADISGVPPSAEGTARQWLVSGYVDNYVKTLERGWFEKDVKCGAELALYYKRNGKYTEAEKIWRQLNRSGSDYYSAVELAKYYEHKLKDYEKALQTVIEVSASPAGILRRKEVEHRKNRLIRKINAEKLRLNKN